MSYALSLLRKIADGINAYKAFKTDPDKYVKENYKVK